LFLFEKDFSTQPGREDGSRKGMEAVALCRATVLKQGNSPDGADNGDLAEDP
jgi:hypothetical protein